MIFFKLIRLGYVIQTYKGAQGDLRVILDAGGDTESVTLTVCHLVDSLDFITVTLAMEDCLRKFCLRNGI